MAGISKVSIRLVDESGNVVDEKTMSNALYICTFEVAEGGSYSVVAEITDDSKDAHTSHSESNVAIMICPVTKKRRSVIQDRNIQATRPRPFISKRQYRRKTAFDYMPGWVGCYLHNRILKLARTIAESCQFSCSQFLLSRFHHLSASANSSLPAILDSSFLIEVRSFLTATASEPFTASTAPFRHRAQEVAAVSPRNGPTSCVPCRRTIPLRPDSLSLKMSIMPSGR